MEVDNMKLNIFERIKLLQIIPTDGNIAKIRLINNLIEKVGFSEEDYAKYRIIELPDKRIVWGKNEDGSEIPGKPYEVEIHIGPEQMKIIEDKLMKLDSENKLDITMYSIIEKFVKEEKKKEEETK